MHVLPLPNSKSSLSQLAFHHTCDKLPNPSSCLRVGKSMAHLYLISPVNLIWYSRSRRPNEAEGRSLTSAEAVRHLFTLLPGRRRSYKQNDRPSSSCTTNVRHAVVQISRRIVELSSLSLPDFVPNNPFDSTWCGRRTIREALGWCLPRFDPRELLHATGPTNRICTSHGLRFVSTLVRRLC